MHNFGELRDRALEELTQVLHLIEAREAEAFADEVLRAKRIFAHGAGRSGLVVRGYAMRLMHLGLTAHCVGEATAPAIAAGDALVVASGSGTTAGIIQVAEKAKGAGARILCLTSDPASPLTALADGRVVIPASTPKGMRTAANAVRSTQPLASLFEQSLFLFCDILIALLKQRLGETEESLAARHANLE